MSILPHLPNGWRVTHLILLDPDWQANITDGEHVAIGTDSTPENAIDQAYANALLENFVGRLASLPPRFQDRITTPIGDLLGAIGLGAKPTVRRKV